VEGPGNKPSPLIHSFIHQFHQVKNKVPKVPNLLDL
jgi:hypothetical protein